MNYRKLPGVPVTEALEDCLDGYRRLLDGGIPGDLIAVVGDSAGGHLALQVALQGRRRGLGSPGAVACISPLV
ncbi:alpha/beta hydrolase, partial [Mycobacterium kansasii]